MNKQVLRLSAAWLGLMFFQVFVLNNVNLGGLVNPYIYPLILLILPFATPAWLLMIIAFGTGLIVDTFAVTPGMHAAACVLMAWLIPKVRNLFIPSGGYQESDRPHIRDLGIVWFVSYAGLLLLFHHFLYFSLEVFSFNQWPLTLVRILLSTLISLVLAVLLDYLFNSNSSRT